MPFYRHLAYNSAAENGLDSRGPIPKNGGPVGPSARPITISPTGAVAGFLAGHRQGAAVERKLPNRRVAEQSAC